MEDLPELIGRYMVRDVIGRGAMGVILRAHDPQLDRQLAIKLIARDLLDGADGEEYVTRFKREARASSRCAHPNIVAVHDFGLHDGRPFLAMEYVEGISIAAHLEAGRRFDAAETARIMGQVLDALACAHDAGIVHRDIKPSNVLLTKDMLAKLADFGIARVGGSDLTRVGDMIGTPSYMSPEQCLGTEVDARSDLFSAGTVLHELLTGMRAFTGATMIETVRRVVDAAPPPLPDALGRAFPSLPSVLDRALAKRREDRFASAAEMAQALRAAMAGGPPPDVTVVQAGAPRPAPPPPPAPAPALLDAETIGTIERNLAAYIGPIAGMMLKSALRQAGSREELLAAVAAAIQSPEDRARFLAEMQRRLQVGPGSAVSPSAAVRAAPPTYPAALDAVRQALLPHIGPLASVLVRRAAADGAGMDAIWQRVASHIENEKERAAFLAKRR
jgi:serine/threonine-protein kinase